jgi:peptide/nickel transport system permease protein
MARSANQHLKRLAGFWKAAKQSGSFLCATSLLSLVLFMAILAPWVAPFDPTAIDPASRLQGSSVVHWFGTDMVGRDLLSRVIWGARSSIFVGMACAVLVVVLGLITGVVTGFFHSADVVGMRVLDGLMAIPPILLAIALMTVIGSGVMTVVLAITVAELPRAARLVRAITLSVRSQSYVEASLSMGSSDLRNIWRNIVPASTSALIVHGTYLCGSAMLTESVLSFIGAGIPTTIPTWGNIMADGRALWQLKPGLVLFPAAALCLTVLMLNLLGDAVRDIVDPRQK